MFEDHERRQSKEVAKTTNSNVISFYVLLNNLSKTHECKEHSAQMNHTYAKHTTASTHVRRPPTTLEQRRCKDHDARPQTVTLQLQKANVNAKDRSYRHCNCLSLLLCSLETSCRSSLQRLLMSPRVTVSSPKKHSCVHNKRISHVLPIHAIVYYTYFRIPCTTEDLRFTYVSFLRKTVFFTKS